MILLHDLYIGPNPIISNMDSLDLLGHQFLHWIPLHENNFIAMILSQEYTTLVSLHSTIMSEIPANKCQPYILLRVHLECLEKSVLRFVPVSQTPKIEHMYLEQK